MLDNFSPELDFWGLVTLCSEEQVRTQEPVTSQCSSSLVVLGQ